MGDQCSQGNAEAGWLWCLCCLPTGGSSQPVPQCLCPTNPVARTEAPGGNRRDLFQKETEATERRAQLHATVLFAHGLGARVFLRMTNSFPEAVQTLLPSLVHPAGTDSTVPMARAGTAPELPPAPQGH